MSQHSFPRDIPVGISQCLLGDSVRYDGSHKHSKYCTQTLGTYFSFVPVCPEMGIGMGAPREAIHLQGALEHDVIRAVGNRTATLDVTEKLEAYGREKGRELTQLCGYILMGRSPSCGMERIKVYHANGNPLGKTSAGLYAREFMKAQPLLPVEEEGRLQDVRLRENFVARVFAYQRWRALNEKGLTLASLQDFHARHKYLLLSHHQPAYRYLGRVVAMAHQRPLADVAEEYGRVFMETLKKVASNRNHSNVLQHLMGYIKNELDTPAKQELLHLIEEYRQGRVPLIAPFTLLRHYLKKHPNAYIERQVYLEPHPADLMLRNFI
ncbi:MAG: DUF523 and DUF1722 domain-containing protein [Moraxellaceae bacterium]|nr:DUF523 and DUF1722 domain-containing protein [Moraxellaceae bacterium]